MKLVYTVHLVIIALRQLDSQMSSRVPQVLNQIALRSLQLLNVKSVQKSLLAIQAQIL